MRGAGRCREHKSKVSAVNHHMFFPLRRSNASEPHIAIKLATALRSSFAAALVVLDRRRPADSFCHISSSSSRRSHMLPGLACC